MGSSYELHKPENHKDLRATLEGNCHIPLFYDETFKGTRPEGDAKSKRFITVMSGNFTMLLRTDGLGSELKK